MLITDTSRLEIGSKVLHRVGHDWYKGRVITIHSTTRYEIHVEETNDSYWADRSGSVTLDSRQTTELLSGQLDLFEDKPC